MRQTKRERQARAIASASQSRAQKGDRRRAKAIALRAARETASQLVNVRSAWDNMMGHGKPRNPWSYSGRTALRIARGWKR